MDGIHGILILGLALLGGGVVFLGWKAVGMLLLHRDKTADELPREFKLWLHFFRIGMVLFLFAGIAVMMLW